MKNLTVSPFEQANDNKISYSRSSSVVKQLPERWFSGIKILVFHHTWFKRVLTRYIIPNSLIQTVLPYSFQDVLCHTYNYYMCYSNIDYINDKKIEVYVNHFVTL